MCWMVAIPIAMAVAAAATSAVSGVASAREQEKDFTNYQSKQLNSTLADFANNINQTNTRYAQEIEAAQQQQQQVYLENLKQQATAQTSATGMGVAGSTLDNLFRDYDRATAISDYITEKNLRYQGLQYNQDFVGLRNRALSSVNQASYYTGAKSKTAMLMGLGGIISASGQAASAYASRTNTPALQTPAVSAPTKVN